MFLQQQDPRKHLVTHTCSNLPINDEFSKNIIKKNSTKEYLFTMLGFIHN